MKNKKPTVTIGISAFNEEANIIRLIQSILHQKEINFKLDKIIVISDGSNDNTDKRIKKIKNSKILFSDYRKRKGLYARQNEIVKRANGDILVILDADIVPKNTLFLNTLIHPIIENKKIGIVGAVTSCLEPVNFIERVLKNSHDLKLSIFKQFRNGNNVYLCHGRVRAFRKSLYKQIKWPKNCPEDSYSYFFCLKKRFAFYYNPNTGILYRLASTIKDHLYQSNRFYTGKKILLKYFSKKLINDQYNIPINIYLKTCLNYLFTKPIATLSYFLIFFYSKTTKFADQNSYSKWTISTTTKSFTIK